MKAKSSKKLLSADKTLEKRGSIGREFDCPFCGHSLEVCSYKNDGSFIQAMCRHELIYIDFNIKIYDMDDDDIRELAQEDD
jgi:transcription elongation factor Elf1